jgi:hypothetical protein
LALIISALEIFLLRKFDPVLKEDAKE